MRRDIILLIGDSLSLPRETIPYGKTWPALLSADVAGCEFINKSAPNATTDVLASPDMLEYYNPDTVIISLGVCDCAPRLFSPIERRIIARLREPHRSRAIKLAKRIKRRKSDRVVVPIDRFRANISNYVQRAIAAGVSRILLVKILRPSAKYRAANEAAGLNIERYNAVIEKAAAAYPGIVTTLDPVSASDDVDVLTLEDGYHLSEDGNQIAAERIFRTLKPDGRGGNT